jgi:transcriptional repressor NrdR
MVCIYCGAKTNIVNSRKRSKGLQTWRRRRCISCRAVFTSIEKADAEQSLRVRKESGAIEPFLYEKLFLDVYRSLSHRKSRHMDAKSLSDTVVTRLLPCKSGILQSSEVKYAAMEVLKRFDKSAATYYRAHHFNV